MLVLSVFLFLKCCFTFNKINFMLKNIVTLSVNVQFVKNRIGLLSWETHIHKTYWGEKWKAGSEAGQLACAANALPLSHDNRSTTNPHNYHSLTTTTNPHNHHPLTTTTPSLLPPPHNHHSLTTTTPSLPPLPHYHHPLTTTTPSLPPPFTILHKPPI